VCLTCRRRLAAEEQCPGDATHPVIDLSRGNGLRKLERAARRTSRKRFLENRARWFLRTLGHLTGNGFIPAVGAVFALYKGISVLPFTLLVTVGALPIVMAYHGFKDEPLFPRLTRKGSDTFLMGAPRIPLALPASERMHGKVVADAALTAPASGAACVAYSLELSHDEALVSTVMFRDSVTIGFEVLLSDGRTLRVGAGEIELRPPPEPVPGRRRWRLRGYLQGIDPRLASRSAGAIPFNQIRERILAPGDEVEVCASVRPEFAPSETAAAVYRAAPTAILVAQAPVVVTVQTRSDPER
jgi:hypothetical protein